MHKPMTWLKTWWLAPAEWWQFWFPQSGGIGGAIFAAIAGSVVLVGLRFLS